MCVYVCVYACLCMCMYVRGYDWHGIWLSSYWMKTLLLFHSWSFVSILLPHSFIHILTCSSLCSSVLSSVVSATPTCSGTVPITTTASRSRPCGTTGIRAPVLTGNVAHAYFWFACWRCTVTSARSRKGPVWYRDVKRCERGLAVMPTP